MKKLNTVKRATLVTAFLAVSGVAQATMITSATNNPLSFNWSYSTGSSLLTGYGTMTLSGFNSSALTISTSLTNTSAIGGQGGERLTSFGFGIDPNATGVTFSDAGDGGMVNAVLSTHQGSTSIPSLHDVIEVCTFGGNNCAGGSNGGIYGAGGSDAFTLVLAGTWGSSVNIEPIGFKYQTGYGSFEFTASSSTGSSSTSSSTSTSSTSSSGTSTSSTSSSGTSTSSTSSSGTSTSSGTVAEPSTSSMVLLALGLLGFALRNSRGLKQR